MPSVTGPRLSRPRILIEGGVEAQARHRRDAGHALYGVEAVAPPRFVQSVWKNSPRGRSIRS